MAAVYAAALATMGLVGCAQTTAEPYKPALPPASETAVPSAPLPNSGEPTTVAPTPPVPPQLLGAPFLFRPKHDAFEVNALLKAGAPQTLLLRARAVGATSWGEPLVPAARATDVAEWEVTGLQAGTRYEYQVLDATSGNSEVDALPVLYTGSGTTQRPPGTAFSFALLSDSHIGYDLAFSNQGDPTVLSAVGEQIAQLQPDFLVNLGDLIDFHQFGFNAPPPDGSITRGAYVNYRESIGDALGLAPHFNVIGNWEGENGNYPADTIQWSREARMLYMPGPDPTTYPLGGSPWQDYYAFTWGDATFFVLNVMTYTPTEHLLSTAGGDVDDWTLGVEQMAWFRAALQASDSRWKFVLIHHAVGGKAGDEANARYGRGGGLAADVGEQAVVHQLMQDHGVQVFFYGHDHVFVDMTVDGVHYTQPGSAGAPWKFATDETGYTEYWSESGWGRVDVAPESVAVTFLSSLGAVLYEYSLE
jgi:hypothetical protein